LAKNTSLGRVVKDGWEPNEILEVVD